MTCLNHPLPLSLRDGGLNHKKTPKSGDYDHMYIYIYINSYLQRDRRVHRHSFNEILLSIVGGMTVETSFRKKTRNENLGAEEVKHLRPKPCWAFGIHPVSKKAGHVMKY